MFVITKYSVYHTIVASIFDTSFFLARFVFVMKSSIIIIKNLIEIFIPNKVPPCHCFLVPILWLLRGISQRTIKPHIFLTPPTEVLIFSVGDRNSS